MHRLHKSPAALVEPGLRERKKRETHDRIVAAAFELFQSQGYEETTLQQIAARADVAVRTVSNYFPQKVDLLVAYRESMLAVVEGALDASAGRDPLERVRLALLAVSEENERHPNGRIAQRLLARHGSYQALERIQERFRDDLRAVLETARLRPGTDLDMAVLALSAAFLAVIRRWAAGTRRSLVADAERLFEQWTEGVRG